jgi:hypothetical protein
MPSEILFNDTTELILFSVLARDMGVVGPRGHVIIPPGDLKFTIWRIRLLITHFSFQQKKSTVPSDYKFDADSKNVI